MEPLNFFSPVLLPRRGSNFWSRCPKSPRDIVFEGGFSWKKKTKKQSNSHRLKQKHSESKQSAGGGQTVNNQSCPFKCQLSWKQVQKRRIWTVAEQPGSRLATPRDSSVPPHGATALYWSTESYDTSKVGGGGPWKKKTAERPPDGLILLFSVVLATIMWKMCKSKSNCLATCSWGLLFLSARWDGRLIMVL